MATDIPETEQTAGQSKKYTPRMKLGMILALLTVMFYSTSSLLLIFFAMLPTFVAYVIDRSYNRSNTICVGAANLCGVFPFLLELWLGQHSIAGAIIILTNLFNIAIMYFAAAFGWMLFIAVPPVVVSVQRVFDQHHVVNLKAQQRKLLEEWSKAVAEDVKDSAVLKETLAKSSDKKTDKGKADPKVSASELANTPPNAGQPVPPTPPPANGAPPSPQPTA
ncbi:MAG: hypothetical protein ACO3MW_03535 [Rhodospirillales bacterium]|jgi:hypothetical protein